MLTLISATLRLTPKLPTSVAVAQFEDVTSAVSAVTEVLQSSMGSHIRMCNSKLHSNPLTRLQNALNLWITT